MYQSVNETNGWHNNNQYNIQEALALQNKYMYGYSHFIYLRMIMILLCKTTLITDPYGTMDPLNNRSFYDNLSDSESPWLPESNEELFFGERNDTSKDGLFWFDLDVDDICKTSQTKNSGYIQSKIYDLQEKLTCSVKSIDIKDISNIKDVTIQVRCSRDAKRLDVWNGWKTIELTDDLKVKNEISFIDTRFLQFKIILKTRESYINMSGLNIEIK